jgi:hypothetical protein
LQALIYQHRAAATAADAHFCAFLYDAACITTFLSQTHVLSSMHLNFAGLLIYQHSTVAAMAAAIESQCGKYIITDVASRHGSFSMIGAGSCYQGFGSSSATSFTTAAGRPDSRNSCYDKDWAGLGQAAAAAAGAAAGDPIGAKGAVGYSSLSSRGLPVWLATVLQIGALFLLGMLGYVIACCFLEVRQLQKIYLHFYYHSMIIQ